LDSFEKAILDNQDKAFFVVNPPGMSGDQLIFKATQKKLNRFGVHYVTSGVNFSHELGRILWEFRLLVNLKPQSRYLMNIGFTALENLRTILKKRFSDIKINSAGIILIRGGGYLNDIWGNYIFLEEAIGKNPDAKVIIAPHSFFFYTHPTRFVDIFRKRKNHFILFCREKYSYELLQSFNLPTNTEVHLADDTAFYLSKEDFHARDEKYDIVCPREDKESPEASRNLFYKRYKNNTIDLRHTEEKVFIGDISFFPFSAWVNLIEGSRRVYTDRLHVAILSAILGKETYFYPNVYHKNKGVYEYSLCRYPNVRFVDSVDALKKLSADILRKCNNYPPFVKSV